MRMTSSSPEARKSCWRMRSSHSSSASCSNVACSSHLRKPASRISKTASTSWAERAKVRREVPDHTVQEEYARLLGKGARCDSSESQRKSGKSDQDAQPDHPWMGKLSPSYLGVFNVPEDGNGPLALALAMGEVPPSKQDLCLDRKTILASAWRTEVVLRCGCWP